MSSWHKENPSRNNASREKRYSVGSLAGLPPTSATTKSNSSDKRNIGDTYRVVFWGQCARGYQRPDVIRAFASRFKISSQRQLEQLFSGKVITLKKGLTTNQADRYTDAIQMVGGVCRKESEQRDYFSETEFKTRNTVSFLDEDFDPSSLSLAPKDEFSLEH
jgi:hypothetical protein